MHNIPKYFPSFILVFTHLRFAFLAIMLAAQTYVHLFILVNHVTNSKHFRNRLIKKNPHIITIYSRRSQFVLQRIQIKCGVLPGVALTHTHIRNRLIKKNPHIITIYSVRSHCVP